MNDEEFFDTNIFVYLYSEETIHRKSFVKKESTDY